MRSICFACTVSLRSKYKFSIKFKSLDSKGHQSSTRLIFIIFVLTKAHFVFSFITDCGTLVGCCFFCLATYSVPLTVTQLLSLNGLKLTMYYFLPNISCQLPGLQSVDTEHTHSTATQAYTFMTFIISYLSKCWFLLLADTAVTSLVDVLQHLECKPCRSQSCYERVNLFTKLWNN